MQESPDVTCYCLTYLSFRIIGSNFHKPCTLDSHLSWANSLQQQHHMGRQQPSLPPEGRFNQQRRGIDNSTTLNPIPPLRTEGNRPFEQELGQISFKIRYGKEKESLCKCVGGEGQGLWALRKCAHLLLEVFSH